MDPFSLNLKVNRLYTKLVGSCLFLSLDRDILSGMDIEAITSGFRGGGRRGGGRRGRCPPPFEIPKRVFKEGSRCAPPPLSTNPGSAPGNRAIGLGPRTPRA